MTDELYEKAVESATDSNQTNVYYKSELANGAWEKISARLLESIRLISLLTISASSF